MHAPALMAVTGRHYERGYPGIAGISSISPRTNSPQAGGEFPSMVLYNQTRLGSSLTVPQITREPDQPRK